jgi:hypothetical protein
MSDHDRLRFRVSADRQAANRRVRYVETNRPDDGSCTICQLDEENPGPCEESNRVTEKPSDDEGVAATALIQAIENQLEAGAPAAVQATLNKLTLVGYEREESLELMAHVLANEIHQMLAENRPFDGQRYEALLRQLPDLPE